MRETSSSEQGSPCKVGEMSAPDTTAEKLDLRGRVRDRLGGGG